MEVDEVESKPPRSLRTRRSFLPDARVVPSVALRPRVSAGTLARPKDISQAASQAVAFYREIATIGSVWTIHDAGGFPSPKNSDGRRAQPFWSSRSRAERVVATVPTYASFVVVEIKWKDFCERWIPGLARDGILVGVNWSGARATGYDVEPDQVLANVRRAAG